jgi:hypothetical protein
MGQVDQLADDNIDQYIKKTSTKEYTGQNDNLFLGYQEKWFPFVYFIAVYNIGGRLYD